MRLKSFYGANVTEAMRQVREALGDNAIIVATRDDEMGGVRVTAAVDDPVSAPEKVRAPIQNDDTDTAVIDQIASACLAHQVPSLLSEKLIATATQFAGEETLLALGAALDMHLSFGPLSLGELQKPLILIGPPGAGKTLSTAKLATQATLAKMPVAVISTDTQRAGGMEQLAAFVRLLEIDLIEIEDPHALQDAIDIQKKGTLILIDTAGCNPFDHQDKQNLSTLIKTSKAMPLIIMPADMDALESLDMVKEYQGLGASHLFFTRLDMTRRMGGLLRVAYESKLTLSQYSASSKVTEQPYPLNPVSLARVILPKSSEGQRKATGTT